MKRFSYIIFPLFLIASVLGCKDSDPGGSTTYIYKNSSTRNITLTIYSQKKNEGKKQLFSLHPGQSYELKYTYLGDGTSEPFSREVYYDSDYIIVSNGLQNVFERVTEENVLYDLGSYETVKLGKYVKVFQYTFTDAYFENGEPVTE